jgi:hypothetical protein
MKKILLISIISVFAIFAACENGIDVEDALKTAIVDTLLVDTNIIDFKKIEITKIITVRDTVRDTLRDTTYIEDPGSSIYYGLIQNTQVMDYYYNIVGKREEIDTNTIEYFYPDLLDSTEVYYRMFGDLPVIGLKFHQKSARGNQSPKRFFFKEIICSIDGIIPVYSNIYPFPFGLDNRWYSMNAIIHDSNQGRDFETVFGDLTGFIIVDNFSYDYETKRLKEIKFTILVIYGLNSNTYLEARVSLDAVFL